MPTYRLDDWVAFLSPGKSSDFEWGTGKEELVAESWAEITPLSGRLLEVARQLCPTVTHRVRCRFNPNIKPSQRIDDGFGLVLQIEAAVNVDNRDEYWELSCTQCPDAK